MFSRIRSSLLFLIALGLPLLGATSQGQTYSLAHPAIVEGPEAGYDSVTLTGIPAMGTWRAWSNVRWLHVMKGSASGIGDASVHFQFDANQGPTRSGLLMVGENIYKVTQASPGYVAVQRLKKIISGLNGTAFVALDVAGNVYFTESTSRRSTMKKWSASTHELSTLVSSGLTDPGGIAVDHSGNVYIANADSGKIKKWNPVNRTLTTVIASGLNNPLGLAVDESDNLYIADCQHDAIKKFNPATGKLITAVSGGLNQPFGVAIYHGNIYIADTANNAMKECSPAAGQVTRQFSSDLISPGTVAADRMGNVYFAGGLFDSGEGVLEKYDPATGSVTTLLSSIGVTGVAVESSKVMYIADGGQNAIDELSTIAYVDTTIKYERANAGQDYLAPVLPKTRTLSGEDSPKSDESWLAIGPIRDGVVWFTFTANTTGAARAANISLLGEQITVIQGGE